MSYAHISFATEGCLAVVTLNRPQRRNALSLALMLELIDCLNTIGTRRDLRAVILAAGLGTRMRSAVPKVLHRIAGQPMLQHLLASCDAVFDRVVGVVGPGMAAVEEAKRSIETTVDDVRDRVQEQPVKTP